MYQCMACKRLVYETEEGPIRNDALCKGCAKDYEESISGLEYQEHDPDECRCTYLGNDAWNCGHIDQADFEDVGNNNERKIMRSLIEYEVWTVKMDTSWCLEQTCLNKTTAKSAAKELVSLGKDVRLFKVTRKPI